MAKKKDECKHNWLPFKYDRSSNPIVVVAFICTECWKVITKDDFKNK